MPGTAVSALCLFTYLILSITLGSTITFMSTYSSGNKDAEIKKLGQGYSIMLDT